MEILQENNNSIYFAFKSTQKTFCVGDEPVKFNRIQLDFNTLKTGWGRYCQQSNQYQFEFDVDKGLPVGSALPEPNAGDSNKFRKAFEVWVMLDGVETRPYLWRRETSGEHITFMEMLSSAWDSWHTSQDKELLPVYRKKELITKTWKNGNKTYIASFTFEGLEKRWDNFVSYNVDQTESDDDWISPNAGLSDKVDEQVAKSGDLSEDDLPF